MADPSVSVIIPSHNRAALLPRAIGSALRAVEPEDEVIVVDDGSTDGTEGAVTPFHDRIRFVRVPHGGAGRARNRGVALARRPLVAFLDSDDEWTPDKLALQRSVLARRDVLFCFTDFGTRRAGRADQSRRLVQWRRDPRGWHEILGAGLPYATIADLPPGRDDFAVHIGDLYPELVRNDLVPTSTLVVDRAAAGAALRFAEDLPTYEDLECHIRLARAGPAAYLDCDTAWQWGHTGPRLSTVDRGTWAATRLAILERTYGRDADFMARHRPRVEEACAHQRLVRARWLIGVGDRRGARCELHKVDGGPISYRILAWLPGWRPMWLRHTVRAMRRLAVVSRRRHQHRHRRHRRPRRARPC
jgi:glycosyltransferase involved in cell wall biosynthesis